MQSQMNNQTYTYLSNAAKTDHKSILFQVKGPNEEIIQSFAKQKPKSIIHIGAWLSTLTIKRAQLYGSLFLTVQINKIGALSAPICYNKIL